MNLKNKKALRQKSAVGLAVFGGTLILTFALAWWNPLERWQLKLTNRFYDRNQPSSDIIIVGIDENSLDEENGLGRWQDWNRTYYATTIENLENAGAKLIIFDLTFTESSKGISESSLKEIIEEEPSYQEYFKETSVFLSTPHPEDQILADTLSEYDNVVIGEKHTGKVDSNVVSSIVVSSIPNLQIFTEHTATASLYGEKDVDESIRRFALEVWDQTRGEKIPTLAVKIFELLGGNMETIKKHTDENGNILINYAAPPYSFKMVSFAGVYAGNFEPDLFKDKIVLVGSVTQYIEDHSITPTNPDLAMPGVEIHANAIQTLLEENYLKEQSLASQLSVTAALVAVLVAAVMALGIFPGLFAAIAIIAGYHLAAEPVFDRGLILNLVYPTIALFIAYLATTLYKYTTETREKRDLRNAFSKYVNKDLVSQIMENRDLLQLGGAKRMVSVFFSDIENFTHYSEALEAEALVAQLNEYFGVMTDIILKSGGTLDKFEGDAIMAFWGAPLEQADHAQRAADTALACRAALADLHTRWQSENKPLLNFRVGLATGEAIAGNIGSWERFDYTVMGDIVNLGARLEGANKRYGTRVMISAATAQALGDQFEVRRLDRLRVKGKDNAVEIYELMAKAGQLGTEHHALIDEFHQALDLYFSGKFTEAHHAFTELAVKIPHDGPTQTYLKRCAELQENPPETWDGIWTLHSK